MIINVYVGQFSTIYCLVKWTLLYQVCFITLVIGRAVIDHMVAHQHVKVSWSKKHEPNYASNVCV